MRQQQATFYRYTVLLMIAMFFNVTFNNIIGSYRLRDIRTGCRIGFRWAEIMTICGSYYINWYLQKFSYAITYVANVDENQEEVDNIGRPLENEMCKFVSNIGYGSKNRQQEVEPLNHIQNTSTFDLSTGTNWSNQI
eukprot:403359739